MADSSISLRIYLPNWDKDLKPVDKDGNSLNSLTMTSGSPGEEGYISCEATDGKETTTKNFKVSIKDIGFHKKMYSPNVITTTLHITEKTTQTAKEEPPSKAVVERAFLNKRVELFANKDTNLSVCNDYYIERIEPLYLKTELYLKLTIYSPDYQLTIEKNCKAFVAKTLSKIISTQKDNYVLPYNNGAKVAINLEPDSPRLQHIVKGGKEHIFPYLVQYNESYYDFLKRTTNRWGEFLYYEDGQLQIGYDSDAKPTIVDDYYSRTYCAIDASMAKSDGSKFHPQATADENMLNNPMTKDKFDIAKGLINSLGDDDLNQSKYIMSKISSFFGNGKPLGTWAINTVIDDLVAWGMAEKRSKGKNDMYNNKYFKSVVPETTDKNNEENNESESKDKNVIDVAENQYNGDKTKLNQFSEFKPLLDATDYANLLKMELTAGRDAMVINFQTTYPNLKLGQQIQVAGEDYLVVELRGYQPKELTTYYEATCISKAMMSYTKEDKKKNKETITYKGFFPPLLETGHVRKTELQHAVVTDADDPLRANRVRVKFEWQGDDDDASPWLVFAQSAATDGAGVHGRHYNQEKVLVDFINGNIERPYVIGAVYKKTPTPLRTGSITMMSPGGNGMRVTDGTGAGYTAFLASITPGIKMLQSMFPGRDPVGNLFNLNDEEKKESKRFEGSTEICDYYGIYSIKGSTDGRNISIKSPWGDVKINAFTGISVSAPNGDIKIQGKNVTIEAGNNLKLISGTNIKNKFISRGNGDWKEVSASVLADVSLIVGKKMQELVLRVIDLSLVRSILEVGFRPQEGLLEIQSNRFLKLEAGGAKAGYPLTSYSSTKSLEKEFKEKVAGTFKMKSAIVQMIHSISPCVDHMIKNYRELYNVCLKKKHELRLALDYLKDASNGGKYYIGKDGIIQLLWNKDTKEIKESDLKFVEDEVGITDDSRIGPHCKERARNRLNFMHDHPFGPKNYVASEEEIRNLVLKRRKEGRKKVVEKANALLKSIDDLRHLRLKNYQSFQDIYFFKSSFSKFVPKDYVELLTKCFDPEKLKNINIFSPLFDPGNNDAVKQLNANALNNLVDSENNKLAFKRQVALNLLEGWGIKAPEPVAANNQQGNNVPLQAAQGAAQGDAQQDAAQQGAAQQGAAQQGAAQANAQANAQAPVQANAPVNGANPAEKKLLTQEQLLGDYWTRLLQGLTTDGKIIEGDTGFVKDVLSSIPRAIDFDRPRREYFSWGNAKDGKILFSDKTTYQLGGEMNKVVETKYSGGKLKKEDFAAENIEQKITNFITPIRDALAGLGNVVQQANAVNDENPNADNGNGAAGGAGGNDGNNDNN